VQDFFDGKNRRRFQGCRQNRCLTLFIRPEQLGISKKVSRYDGKCAADIAA